MNVRAKVTIKLFADEVLVAESSDAVLWSKILNRLTSGQSDSGDEVSESRRDESREPLGGGGSATLIAKFASQLGTSVEVLQGACDPKTDAPYLHLNPHEWEAFAKNNPTTGPTAISGLAVSATLLLLWARHAGISPVKLKDATAVLGTLSIKDGNPSRTINRAEWLQNRGGALTLNPARISRAITIAKAFCEGTQAQEAKEG